MFIQTERTPKLDGDYGLEQWLVLNREYREVA